MSCVQGRNTNTFFEKIKNRYFIASEMVGFLEEGEWVHFQGKHLVFTSLVSEGQLSKRCFTVTVGSIF